MNKELVISAYQRDYSWINLVNNDNVKKTVYRKGNKLPHQVVLGIDEIFIENNVGQDVHTFFNHIVLNYNNLADYTFFSQDYPFDHVSNYIDIINGERNYWDHFAKLRVEETWFFSDGSALNGAKTLKCFQDGLPHHHGEHSPLNIDTLWEVLFESSPPSIYEFVPAGHFCVSRTQVQQRDVEFYKRIVEQLETRDKCPWEMERLEPYVFNSQIK